MTRSHRVRRDRARTVLALVVIALVAAACGSTARTTGPSIGQSAGSPSPAASPLSTASGAPSEQPRSPAPGEPGQTDTEWGRIWDELPAWFPRYPGSIATETGEGPVSATLAVPTDARTAADYMQAALETATYSTEAKSGPFEDGSYVIDSTGADPACRIETRLTPRSGTTTMTVMFGAACPFE